MHYVEQSEGIPVVLCHGLPHRRYSWKRQIPALAAAGFRMIAPDMRGMGKTDAPESFKDYGVDSLTADRDLAAAPRAISLTPGNTLPALPIWRP